MKLISWNVNGIRAVYKKGFLEWVKKENPDILCLQEIKAHEEQIPDELKKIPGYHSYFSMGEKKGYSGVAIWTKEIPLKVNSHFLMKELNGEGRILELEYNNFFLYNVYFPNGKASPERLLFKLSFYKAFLTYIKKKKKGIIICGDVNTAHTENDLARPKENEKISGFLPEERSWIDQLLKAGFSDSFRFFHKNNGYYTWWDVKTRARERNVGWRIDYFFLSNNLMSHLKMARIHSNVEGSDHCPISIDIEF